MATHSTADRPGGPWGSYALDHVWRSVFVTITGDAEWQDTGTLSFTGLSDCKSGTKYYPKRAQLRTPPSCDVLELLTRLHSNKRRLMF